MGNPNDPWEELRWKTVDELITMTKLSGSALMLDGYTTPEGWRFWLTIGVASPGNERIRDLMRQLRDALEEHAGWSLIEKNPKIPPAK